MTIDLLDVTWNDDIIDDVAPVNYDNVVVYSRDWTVETIANQISQGNIDLNPRFQRRNAWNDLKRSRLIESLVLGIPIPEIVLAEDPTRRKSFLVIDGKQRLLTISGFIDSAVPYWNRPELSGLTARPDLNGVTCDTLKNDLTLQDSWRAFLNADVRCTIISNYQDDNLLYDIFYRLNTGSVPLSTQELRQVLNKGDFANYLIESTSHIIPLHQVLRLDEPDPRLRDVEILLRFLAFSIFGNQYRGNLKKFLDDAMGNISDHWNRKRASIETAVNTFNQATQRAIGIFDEGRVGRKYTAGKWESRFNKSLFEVVVYYIAKVPDNTVNDTSRRQFVDGIKDLCENNAPFRSSIEATTKTNDNYIVRFSAVQDLTNRAFGLNISDIPILP